MSTASADSRASLHRLEPTHRAWTDLYPALLATLLAQGTNMGVAQMAQAARIPVDTLAARLAVVSAG